LILAIGDIHGCYDAPIALVAKSRHGFPFRHLRRPSLFDTNRWLAVRGNHDNGALTAVHGDKSRRRKKR
jgi:hypothetical protein